MSEPTPAPGEPTPSRAAAAGASPSPDQKTPAQQALDLLVFAPAGLVATAIEDLPELAAKGRSRVEGHLKNAHLVGRLVVNLGQRDLQRRIGGLRARPDAPTPAPPPGSAGEPAEPARGAERSRTTSGGTPLSLHRDPSSPATGGTGSTPPRAPMGDPVGERPGPLGPVPTVQPARATAPAPAAGEVPPVDLAAPAVPGQPGSEAVDAAIPGYDTLSASQVVRRLDGLGAAELEAVVRHETATRGRRTILHRAQQLLGTEESPGSDGGAP